MKYTTTISFTVNKNSNEGIFSDHREIIGITISCLETVTPPRPTYPEPKPIDRGKETLSVLLLPLDYKAIDDMLIDLYHNNLNKRRDVLRTYKEEPNSSICSCVIESDTLVPLTTMKDKLIAQLGEAKQRLEKELEIKTETTAQVSPPTEGDPIDGLSISGSAGPSTPGAR